MEIYFSDYFRVSENKIDKYGAFNISLLFDLPLFIDPFLLFNSRNSEYQKLHDSMIEYLRFLKDKSVSSVLPEGLINAWYRFPEVSQNWFGYSKNTNKGRGLGSGFAYALNSNLQLVFKNFGEQQSITRGNHLEKLYILNKGIGKDRISDFTTNLIKKYLLKYTQEFALDNISNRYLKEFTIRKVEFNYETESWMNDKFVLPVYKNDYVLLTPKNILTKDDTWINNTDLIKDFNNIVDSVPNDQLREQINNYFRKLLPIKPTYKDKKEAKIKTLNKYKILIDYYIRYKEKNGEDANIQSQKKVLYTNKIFVQNAKYIIENIFVPNNLYKLDYSTYSETSKRIYYFKDIIENKDGYKIFYYNNEAIAKEEDIQLLFRFVWYASPSDISRETNSGRGPVDYKISKGSLDKSLVEFKLARSSSLKKNLQNQVSIYKKANDTDKAFVIIVYFKNSEYERAFKILKELKMENEKHIIFIDASPKISASKA